MRQNVQKAIEAERDKALPYYPVRPPISAVAPNGSPIDIVGIDKEQPGTRVFVTRTQSPGDIPMLIRMISGFDESELKNFLPKDVAQKLVS
jgi:hypothetical protein